MKAPYMIGALVLGLSMWWGIYVTARHIARFYIPFPVCYDGRCG